MYEKDIDLCVATLLALKVGLAAYASSAPYAELRIKLVDALDKSVQTPMGKAIAAAIRAG